MLADGIEKSVKGDDDEEEDDHSDGEEEHLPLASAFFGEAAFEFFDAEPFYFHQLGHTDAGVFFFLLLHTGNFQAAAFLLFLDGIFVAACYQVENIHRLTTFVAVFVTGPVIGLAAAANPRHGFSAAAAKGCFLTVVRLAVRAEVTL